MVFSLFDWLLPSDVLSTDIFFSSLVDVDKAPYNNNKTVKMFLYIINCINVVEYNYSGWLLCTDCTDCVGKFYCEKKAICADIVNLSLKITLPSEAVYFSTI